MSDDEEGRLLIDDHDMSGGPGGNSMTGDLFASVANDDLLPSSVCLNSDFSDMKKDDLTSVPSLHRSHFSLSTFGSNGLGAAATSDSVWQPDPRANSLELREEGEIVDEMDTSGPSAASLPPFQHPQSIAVPSSTAAQSPWPSPQLPFAASHSSPKSASHTSMSSTSAVPSAADPSTLCVETAFKTDKIVSSLSSTSGRAPPPKKSPVPTKISPGRGKKIFDDEKPTLNGVDKVSISSRPKYPSHGSAHGHSLHAEDKKIKDESREEKKRVSSACRAPDPTPTKRHKVQMRDKGTTVHPVAVQNESDEHIFEQEPGSTGVLQYTVVCKTDNNAVYIAVRFKDQELFGVISDGQPINFANVGKKRPNLNGSSRGDGDGSIADRAGSGASTPSKNNRIGGPSTPRDQKRGNRGSSVPSEKKKSTSGLRLGVNEIGDKEEDDCEQVDGGPSRGGHLTLCEVPDHQFQHMCPVDGCGHRYDKASELEYHKMNAHPKKQIVTDSRCTQTEIKKSDETGTDPPTELAPKMEHVEVQTDAPPAPVAQPGAIFPGGTQTYELKSGLTGDEMRGNISLMISKARRETAETIPATASDAAFSDISDEDSSLPPLNKPALPMLSRPVPSGGVIGTSASAFTPTEAAARNEDSVAAVQAAQAEQHQHQRKESTVGLSLPLANNPPSAQSTAFQPVESSSGKPRPSSVSAASQGQQMNASPRPSINVAGAPGGPFMQIGMPFAHPYMLNPVVQQQFASSLVGPATSPARPPDSQQHKIHELKSKVQSGPTASHSDPGAGPSNPTGNVASPVGKLPGAPTAPQGTPQQAPRPGHIPPFMTPPIGGGQPGTVSAQQQMQQMAAAQHQQQQQYMMQVMLGGGRFPQHAIPGMTTDMAQLAQLQAMYAAHGAPHNMFQK